MRTRILFLLVALTAGCAGSQTVVIDGHEVPRQTVELTGQPYSLRHERAHPRPGGPSDGLRADGGSIRGKICGMMVDIDVKHEGDHVQLVGSLDNRRDLAIAIAGSPESLHFTGNLGGLGVDFTANPQQLLGHVGLRVFAFDREGYRYRGFMRITGLLGDGRIGALIDGAPALWSLPASDIGAILPLLMTCDGFQRKIVVNGIHVGVGGAATDFPFETSTLYSHGR